MWVAEAERTTHVQVMFDLNDAASDGSSPIWSAIGEMMGSLERGLRDRLAAAKFHAADPNSQRTNWERQRSADELVHATTAYAKVGDPDDVEPDTVFAWSAGGWKYLNIDVVEWDEDWPTVGGEDIGGRWIAKGAPRP